MGRGDGELPVSTPGKQVAAEQGYSRTYLNAKLGPRGTPRFGRKTS